MNITQSEWNDISLRLECHHAVFYKLWSIGKPQLVDNIDTAAVSFDKFGKYINFLFNKDFWNRIDINGKLFVICHEMLHVLLNHGIRSKSVSSSNRVALNISLDVVVNHSLINSFGFQRDMVCKSINKALNSSEEDAKEDCLCWIDTVFPDLNPKENQNFE